MWRLKRLQALCLRRELWALSISRRSTQMAIKALSRWIVLIVLRNTPLCSNTSASNCFGMSHRFRVWANAHRTAWHPAIFGGDQVSSTRTVTISRTVPWNSLLYGQLLTIKLHALLVYVFMTTPSLNPRQHKRFFPDTMAVLWSSANHHGLIEIIGRGNMYACRDMHSGKPRIKPTLYQVDHPTWSQHDDVNLVRLCLGTYYFCLGFLLIRVYHINTYIDCIA